MDVLSLLLGVAIFVVAVFWSTVPSDQLPDLAQFTLLLYPVLYGGLGVAAALLPLRAFWQNHSLRLLLLGLSAEAIAFIVWTPAVLHGTFTEGTPLDIVWMAGLLLIAAAALSSNKSRPIDLESHLWSGSRPLVPLSVAVTATLVALEQMQNVVEAGTRDRVLLALLGSILLLIAIRLTFTVLHIERLKVSEREARHSAETTSASLRAVIDASPFPIMNLDLNDRVLEWSPAAERLLGWTRDEVIGRKPPMVPVDRIGEHEDLLRESAQGDGVLGHEVRRGTKTGREVIVEVSTAPIRNQSGKTIAVMTAYNDVTEQRKAQDALRKSQEQIRSAFEQAVIGMAVATLDGHYLDVNPALCRMLGYSRDELLALNFHDITDPDDREESKAQDQGLLNGKLSSYQMEKRYRHKDGNVVWILLSASLVRDDDDQPLHFVSQIQDISDRKRAEDALRTREQAFRLLFTENPQPMWVFDPDSLQFLEVNDAVLLQYGYSRSEFLSMRITDIRPPEDADRARAAVAEVGMALGHFTGWRHRRKDGSLIDVEVATRRLMLPTGPAILASMEDVTDRKRHEEQLRHLALHDALTGLPNRTLLHDRLEQVGHLAYRAASSFALLLLDLDRFKEVNDTLGHESGDRLLHEVAARLEGAVRRSDTVARLGGDEFAILMPTMDETRARKIAKNIEQTLRQPLILDGHRVDVSASIGIALYPQHGQDGSTLLRHADLAMYTAKRGGSGSQLYAPEQDLGTPQRLALLGDLRDAIENDQLVLHYQPKVHLLTGCAEHVEALVRWVHPEHGVIPPAEFIPIAEETGLIALMTQWVLKEAVQQLRAWQASGLDMEVAVNLSALNLRDPHLPETLAWLLRREKVPAGSLVLEITESSLMGDPELAMNILQQLHDMGVKISIDDFGTGYSSLAYLKQLPADEIKIDRSFVSGMTQSGTVIVRSVVDLARNLGLQVTAEGVENRETWDLLLDMGCTLAQGYHISRPLPAGDVPGWLTAFKEAWSQRASMGRQILVVEDNPVYQELLQALLTAEGYQVRTAGDADEAMAVARGMVPDLIVTDVVLPGMSGLELVKQLRSDARLDATVMVAMTAAPTPEDEIHAREVGCNAYLPKLNRNSDIVQIVRQQLTMPTADEISTQTEREDTA